MKRRIHWSLFLPSALALAAAAGLCVLLWMQQDAFEESFLKLAKHDIRLLTQDATDELSALLENDDFEAVRQYAEDVRHAGIRVIVLDSSGKVIVNAGDRRKNKESLRREFVETLTNGEFIVIRPTEDLGEYRLYSSRKVADHVVQLTIPYGQAKEPMKLAFYGEILSALAGLLVALSVFLVVRQFLRRINALAAVREEQARRLEEAERMERYRREFLENVSHEVKTPIAAVTGAVELLGEEGDDLPEKEKASLFEIVLRESRRLGDVFNDILTLSRIESTDQAHAAFERCDLSALVSEACGRLQMEVDRAGVAVTVTCERGIEVRGNGQRLETVVTNLLGNALRYGGGSDVAVSLERRGMTAVLCVRDKGPGIAAEHVERIFERFYRVDKARSREKGGTGLGLAIVKRIVQMHGGTVRCDSTVGKGCAFIVELPCESS